MIFIDITGGLGNQLFQIFTGISYSIDNNLEFFLPSEKRNKGNKKYYWENLLKELKKYTKNNYYTNKIIRRYFKYQEQKYEYNIIPKNDNIIIHGCFQSEKYFFKNYNDIIKLLNIRQYQKIIYNKFADIFLNKTISLHFRLGDYKNNPHHPIINDQYYIDSIKYLIEKTKINNFIILYFYQKEDQKIILNKIKNIEKHFMNLVFIPVNYNLEDWEELLLMSCCNYHIIANSSFSWWGAYLNKSNDKIVTYPKLWFSGNNAKHNLKDLHPKSWIKI